MNPENIVIVGPTSSGKTDLALHIAAHKNIPVFNCDSVQIYKDLDYLSNKPEILFSHNKNGEIVSMINGKSMFAYIQYSNFTFTILRYKSGTLTVNRSLSALDFFTWGIRTGLFPEHLIPETEVPHYLFDIRQPGSTYSAADFVSDVSRISEQNNLKSKIIVGGTVYYAYHYLLGTQFKEETMSKVESIENPINFLKIHDPESLSIIDNNNLQRLQKAAAYVQSTGKRYSEQYIKPADLLDDFLLIAITPSDRAVYVSKLEQIVRNRMTHRAVDEISSLKRSYGDEITSWLEKVSYEYAAAVELERITDEDIERREAVINQLVIKERQYSRRQTTFIKKMLKDILKQTVSE